MLADIAIAAFLGWCAMRTLRDVHETWRSHRRRKIREARQARIDAERPTPVTADMAPEAAFAYALPPAPATTCWTDAECARLHAEVRADLHGFDDDRESPYTPFQ
ncbi:MAG: hypothetical protein AAF594_16245 [Bacteroidota bacterium]